jgi:hypothetical protein
MADALQRVVHDDTLGAETTRQLIRETDVATDAGAGGDALRRERDALRETLDMIFASRGWRALERLRRLLRR